MVLPCYFDVGLAAGVAFPGRIVASWYEDFDPDYTGWFTTQFSPMARLSATWWPSPRLAWAAPTLSLHSAALLLPRPSNVGFWDGRDHWPSQRICAGGAGAGSLW